MHCREKIFGIGSGFHETWTMKHSRGTTGSRAHPGLLIIQVGVGGAGEVGVGGGGGGYTGSDSAVRSFSSSALRDRDSFHCTSRCTSEASARQMGHVRFVFSHLSTHFAWNSWLQGKTRSSCLHSKSLKHTTHSVCSER